MKKISGRDLLFGVGILLGILATLRQWKRDAEEEPIRQARIRRQLAELRAQEGSSR